MVLYSKTKINDVFTPRSAEINKKIYVDRPELERELRRALEGSLHVVVYGDSGNGKSWLYKKVVGDLGWHPVIANCANARRTKSLTQEILNSATPQDAASVSAYKESKGANIIGAELKHEKQYDVARDEPLMKAFKYIRKVAGSAPALLVLDNLESIFQNTDLMQELGNIITVLDDTRYAQFKVKILIVGVPSGIAEYFSKIENLKTVANRLQEISEVAGLSDEQVKSLTRKGFIELLQLRADRFIFEQWQDHILSVTIGIPQRVHEYCEQLAYIASDCEWKATLEHLDKADKAWLKAGLRESYQAVEQLMNERETKAGRRNQVLYTLGKIADRTFSSGKVEEVLRIHFPNSTKNVTLGVGQILSELVVGENPLIKRTPKGDAFGFTDPRYVMAIRAMLKSEDERVRKVSI